MQEMQEEVRRRELRAGGAPILNQHRPPAAMYNVGSRVAAPPAQQSSNTLMNVRSPRTPLGFTSSLGTNSGYAARQNAPGYNYPDTQYNSTQYGQYTQQYPNRYPISAGGQYGPIMPKPKNEAAIVRGHHPMPNENLLGTRDSNNQEMRSYAEQNRHFVDSQNSSVYPNGNLEQRVDQYANDGVVNRAQNGGEGHSMTTSETLPTRPVLPPENAFNESPPPPPPSTSTHPLYKQADTRCVCVS